ncbi:hypothetical protein GNI_094940 [Gregarina niphandrodes]|uniref:Spindle assembly abnormal protein 6 N-terminal domain-containing protein n=1 Tax=Gregarina niphandrodes TaxID=110365 RepID=A0A023B524_GRENI|nr:hypothetical protein GNI_094940 [Gregarina niphandrodes]EZG58340.1 hypothetical protein GNI_094940 [Gregarina niphandrodes]|eukprot:XP_011130973.1 hypothetical protein GNI_094940 [Gregarina niphandrodes]
MGSMGAVEPLNIKVLIKGTECEPEQVKIEVTSENELFLHFTHKITRETFREICGDQNLLVDMADYPSVIMKMCNSSIQNPKTYISWAKYVCWVLMNTLDFRFTAVVVLHDDGGADLSFVQNIEYKFVELLRFPLVQSSEETLRQSLQFRYHCLRTKISALHARLQDVGAMVQTRNPNLWDDLIKSVGLLVRAYVNDKAVYQSKIGQLSEPLRLPVESMATEGQDWPKTPTSTAPGSPTTPLVLSSIHEVDFNEELKLGIHTPASLLTVQLFEKDFCADIALSEILLASATIPIHCLHPGRNLDLVISVHCTLPQYYSLQALMGKEELVAHEPVAMIARLYVSLTLSMPGRGWTVVLREVAALSLPRGPWTPQALVDPSLEDDELVAITGCDIFSVAKEDGTVSLLSLLDAITSLIFALTEGFDDLGSEAVVTYLKNTKADIPQEERLRMSYVAIVEDLFTLAEYLVVGPIARISKFVHEITHFKRPLTTLCLVLVVWLPFAAPQSALLYSIMVGWFSLFFVTEVGIPTRPTAEANNRFSALISKIQQIQGAEMLVRPIEQSVNVATVRRIRIVELWVKALKTRVLRDAFKERTEHFQASLMRVITHDEGITTLCTQQYGYDTNLTAHITAQCYSTVCAVPQLV